MIRLLFVLLACAPGLAVAAEAIVFVAGTEWDGSDERRIHLMRPDGTDHRMIATKYRVQSASINARGDWIVYTTPRRKELRQVHVSGRHDRVLRNLRHISGAQGPGFVTWSPDGKYILYTRSAANGIIGVEVYDTRRRRIVTRRNIGYASRGGTQLSFQRILWAPDSQHFALVMIHENVPVGSSRKDDGHTYVINRASGRVVRHLTTLDSLLPKAHGFLSRTDMFEYVALGSELTRQNFRTLRSVEIKDMSASSHIYNMANSPNGRWMVVDGINLNNSRLVDNWSSLTGTPRGFSFNRNFVLARIDTLAAVFTTPLGDYSIIDDPTDRDTEVMPNFEWRTIASDRVFRFPTCWGWVVTHRGTNGADTIVGTAGADVIAGGDGDDVIQGRGGNDVLCGGAGNDVIIGGGGDDIMYGDVSIGEANTADIRGAGGDVLRGSAGADAIYGNGGDDEIDGGSGSDVLFGGEGNDDIDGDSGFDFADGGDGTDRCINVIGPEACEQ